MEVFYGELQCTAVNKAKNIQCENKAYFLSDGKLTCGVHSKKAESVSKLSVNPNKEENYQKEIIKRNEFVHDTAKKNRSESKKGHVIVSKLRMMKPPEYVPGYLNVFPNYKHENRQDGFGCSRLSPKSLGPVEHNMPNLPPATTIENFHQFSKFWKFELDEKGNILEERKNERVIAYTSEPKRHKHDKKTLSQYNKNINIPEFSMYYDKDGNEHRYNYLDSRYFYCHFYEILAKQEPDFKELKDMIENGYNLNICGYDGYPVTEDLKKHYKDISKPFGHELVLYTLLTVDSPKNYPWNKYYKKNKEIYENVI